MKKSQITITIACLLFMLLSGCESPGLKSGDPYVPAKVVYKSASPTVNEAAKQSLNEIISSNKNLPKHLICGPFLWTKLEKHANLRNSNFVAMGMKTPIIENGIVKEIKNLQGRLMQGADQVELFWNAMTDVIDLDSNWYVRKLNDKEKDLFWSMIPFASIDEPIFIIEGRNFKLLVNLVKSEGRYELLWIDDFYGVS